MRRLCRAGGPVEGGRGGRRPAVLLTRAVGGREIVERRCALCAAAGVRAGLDLAHARALLPARVTVHVEAHRPDRDAETLQKLACWALRISPTVAPQPPDAIVCDLTGTVRLYGREQRVARSALRAVGRLGFSARAGVASTFGCALAAACYGGETLCVVAPGAERAYLSALPVAAISEDDAMLRAFGELGIERAGQVMDIPRRQLAARFGLALLQRIDRALGLATETIEPVHPPPPLMAERLFDGPTDRIESIEAAARDTLEDLVRQLQSRQRGVRRLDFTIMHPHAAAVVIEVTLSRASGSAKHLWTLVRTRLERVKLAEPVDGLRMAAVRTARLRDAQSIHAVLGDGVGETADESAAVGELTDALVNRLGVERVMRASVRASRLPEASYAFYSVMEDAPGRGDAGGVVSSPRPALLLDAPEPASVMALTPDGPVLEVGWRGARQRAAVCIGPERIGPEWWRWRGTFSARRAALAAPPPERDYFAVQLASGVWLWVCRQAGTTRWFVHGVWA